jgi:hypothetical protein
MGKARFFMFQNKMIPSERRQHDKMLRGGQPQTEEERDRQKLYEAWRQHEAQPPFVPLKSKLTTLKGLRKLTPAEIDATERWLATPTKPPHIKKVCGAALAKLRASSPPPPAAKATRAERYLADAQSDGHSLPYARYLLDAAIQARARALMESGQAQTWQAAMSAAYHFFNQQV